MQAFGSCLQRGDVMGALEPGIEIVDKFGASNVDPGLLATLPNLLKSTPKPRKSAPTVPNRVANASRMC